MGGGYHAPLLWYVELIGGDGGRLSCSSLMVGGADRRGWGAAILLVLHLVCGKPIPGMEVGYKTGPDWFLKILCQSLK